MFLQWHVWNTKLASYICAIYVGMCVCVCVCVCVYLVFHNLLFCSQKAPIYVAANDSTQVAHVVKFKVQSAYKLSEDFAKPYFHKYWTKIHDVTTIWKRNVCSFIVTLNTFDVRPTCDMADVQVILPFPPSGAHQMCLRSLWNCKHSSFKW